MSFKIACKFVYSDFSTSQVKPSYFINHHHFFLSGLIPCAILRSDSEVITHQNRKTKNHNTKIRTPSSDMVTPSPYLFEPNPSIVEQYQEKWGTRPHHKRRTFGNPTIFFVISLRTPFRVSQRGRWKAQPVFRSRSVRRTPAAPVSTPHRNQTRRGR